MRGDGTFVTRFIRIVTCDDDFYGSTIYVGAPVY